MAATSAPIQAFGLRPIRELSATTGIPAQTLRNWINYGVLTAMKHEGIWHSTLIEVRRCDEQQRESGMGKPRIWQMAPELISEIEAEAELARA